MVLQQIDFVSSAICPECLEFTSGILGRLRVTCVTYGIQPLNTTLWARGCFRVRREGDGCDRLDEGALVFCAFL